MTLLQIVKLVLPCRPARASQTYQIHTFLNQTRSPVLNLVRLYNWIETGTA
jgi:hypothetical protein